MKKCFLTSLLIVLLTCSQTVKCETTLDIGVMAEEPPIAYQEDNGELKGLGVDIWERIATIEGWDYQLVPVKGNVGDAIDQVLSDKIDVLIGPVSVTNERLKQTDFSRPYFLSRIGVAVHDSPKSFWSVIATFISPAVITTVVIFTLLFVVFTHIYWFFERGKTEIVDSSYRRGIWHAGWQTLTSFLRDVIHDPVTTGGRLTLALWLVCSVTFMTLFAAIVTSSLTVTLFHEHSQFEKPHDLYNKKVAVEKGSKEANIVKELGADYVLADNPLHELQDLDRSKYDAVVAPYEILHQELRNHPELKVHLSSLILAHEAFAFVISSKHELHQQINLTLTKLQDEGITRHFCQQHAIEFSHSCDF